MRRLRTNVGAAISAALFIAFLIFLQSCRSDTDSPPAKKPDATAFEFADAPEFSADSAYAYIQRQVAFGPRVPNSAGHKACGVWLETELRRFADRVLTQEAVLTAYDGTGLESKNIIASFNPQHAERILLCAHWDTRPFAEQDRSNPEEPIDGANDGGSGVGVLLEIARLLKQQPPGIGVDIVLFDSEDYGQPGSQRPQVPDSYCLGSQYWSKQPHVKNYTARFGILLDMVGAANSTFGREGTSMYFASSIMTPVWDVANKLGYGSYFLYDLGDPVTDDHSYINRLLGIPTIDIIHRDKQTRHGFGAYWHTHDDNMDVIDKSTLKAVGQTVMQVVCNFDRGGRIR